MSVGACRGAICALRNIIRCRGAYRFSARIIRIAIDVCVSVIGATAVPHSVVDFLSDILVVFSPSHCVLPRFLMLCPYYKSRNFRSVTFVDGIEKGEALASFALAKIL